jgi:hypothetical protein
MNRNGQAGLVVLIVLGSLIGLVVLGAIGVGLNLITIPWLKFSSQVQMNRDIVTKTYNADNAIYNYHWFQERSGAIIALDATIKQSQAAQADFEASAGPRSQWTFEDKAEDSRLRAVVQGQEAQYNSLVNEYNARAGEADRSIFQNGLALFFSLKAY